MKNDLQRTSRHGDTLEPFPGDIPTEKVVLPPIVRSPIQDHATIASLATENLSRVIAIDSHSDASCSSIPSTPGQRVLANLLEGFFTNLGYNVELDQFANLLVTIPANSPTPRPTIALMVHMDTSEGTQAVSALESVPAWNGARIAYPKNPLLTVTSERYPELGTFLGHDLLHGPGEFPVGLDDKVGMSELMTLGQLLKENPDISHGDIVLVFRPDEEIGRMEAVAGLADEFVRRGVRYGYTIDGIAPFEINTENFEASLATIQFTPQPIALAKAPHTRLVELHLSGVQTHGATAKAEGHLNSTLIFSKTCQKLLGNEHIVPVYMVTDALKESDAQVGFLLRGASKHDIEASEAALFGALTEQLAPHTWKGAGYKVLGTTDGWDEAVYDGAQNAARIVTSLLEVAGPTPILSEESAGYEGYSNPLSIEAKDSTGTIAFRLRAFSRDELTEREEHVARVFQSVSPLLVDGSVSVQQQYINMGSELAKYPELVTWAREAAHAIGEASLIAPIRGGTGVDPFVNKGIPLANLGTGYFAPESEKEITSQQMLARHSLWLTSLVQVVRT